MPTYYTYAESAQIARCSVLTLKRAGRAGEFKVYKPGKECLIEQDDLFAWIKSRQVKRKPKKSDTA